jgi:hypothetical protein
MSHSGASTTPQVPVLTDVVEWNAVVPAPPVTARTEVAAPVASEPLPAGLGAEPPTHDELVARVLAQVQRQVDLMLDYRLRESLTPVLSRLADALVREARAELASTLRDVVARAVTEELARRQGG